MASFESGKENAGKFYEIISIKEQDFNRRGRCPDSYREGAKVAAISIIILR